MLSFHVQPVNALEALRFLKKAAAAPLDQPLQGSGEELLEAALLSHRRSCITHTPSLPIPKALSEPPRTFVEVLSFLRPPRADGGADCLDTMFSDVTVDMANREQLSILPNWQARGWWCPGMVLRAARVAVAADDPSCTVSTLVDMLAQTMYEDRLIQLEGQGINLARCTLLPDAAGADHAEDPNHKMKNVVSSVRGQPSAMPPPARALRPGELLVNEAQIVQVCQGQPDLTIICRLLEQNVDSMRVVFKDVMFSLPRLPQRLMELGRHVEAPVVLRVMGAANMAWDLRGLTEGERTWRLQRLRTMLLTVLAERIRSCDAMFRSHVAGFPRDQIWSLLHNVDVRRTLLLKLPWLAPLLNERMISQDDVELEFSCLVFILGWKPEWRTALARMRSVDALAAMRADPELGIFLTTSTKSTYTYNERSNARQGSDDWNDGSRMGVAAQEAELEGRIRKATRMLPGAHSTVRSFAAHRA